MSASTISRESSLIARPASSPQAPEHAPQKAASETAKPKFESHNWKWSELEWKAMGPFIFMHVAAVFGTWWAGVTTEAVIAAVALYFIRMFAITGGYHRYFSHRTYRTSRVFQFILAFIAESSSQRGVLWWAAHHRRHHKLSDQPGDVHSPRLSGFLYSHMLWLFHGNHDTDFDRIKDFAKYPELRFLNRFWLLPPAVLAVGLYLWMGWSGLFIGYFASTVVLYHGTFTINSLSHVFGKRRFETTDDSKNNWFLALVTLGEGWHNNHHHYMHSTRQGIYWWELDITYIILRGLALMGIVWDLREPPARIYEEAEAAKAAKAA